MGNGDKGDNARQRHPHNKHQLYYDLRDYTISHIDPWDDGDRERRIVSC